MNIRVQGGEKLGGGGVEKERKNKKVQSSHTYKLEKQKTSTEHHNEEEFNVAQSLVQFSSTSTVRAHSFWFHFKEPLFLRPG